MSYIGNQPAESYASFERQVFTIVNSQTAYTLTHAVTNENDIRLVVNNVVQEPGSGKAYTASGTTLTLSAALVNGTDEMYCVYLGRALQTVNPPNASVGTAQLADSAVSTAKIADDAVTKAKTSNLLYPAFEAYMSSNQTSISDATETKVQVNTEVFDTDNCYDNSTNYRFTPTVAGKYYVYGKVHVDDAAGNMRNAQTWIYKNGSGYTFSVVNFHSGDTTDGEAASPNVSAVIDMNGTSDYVELYGLADLVSGTGNFLGNSNRPTTFGAYRIGD